MSGQYPKNRSYTYYLHLICIPMTLMLNFILANVLFIKLGGTVEAFALVFTTYSILLQVKALTRVNWRHEGKPSQLQICVKFINLVYYKEGFVKMLDNLDKFWKIEDIIPKDSEAYDDIDTIITIRNFFIKVFISGGAVHVLSFIAIPPFQLSPNGGKKLPFDVWLPADSPSPYYELLYLNHIYTVCMAWSIVAGFDGMYVLICGSIASQLRTIGYCLEHLNLSGKEDQSLEGPKTLKECIAHHTFILE